MKHKGWWLLGGALGAFAVYEVFFAEAVIPAGYVAVNIAPGAISAAHPAGGQVAFVLPSGAQWSAVGRSGPGFPQQTAVAIASSTKPLYQSAIGPASAFLMQWRDRNGNLNATGVLFT